MDKLNHRSIVVPQQNVQGVDGLRAISLLLVLQAHWAPLLTVEKIANWGRAGLLIFFVISGFLITRILVDLSKRRRQDGAFALLKTFYARRFLRIQPIYYIALAFLLYMGLSDAVAEHWFSHAMFLQNISNVIYYNDIGAYGPAAPWWSLAVEEQFYIFWAPLVIFLRPSAWRVAIGGAFVLAIGWRLFAWYADLGQASLLITFGNLDSLAAGALVAILTSGGRPGIGASRFFSVIMVVGAVSLCPLSMWGANVVLADVPVYMVASSLIFFLATGGAKAAAQVLENPVLVFIGKRSYGAYVYHQVVNFTFYYYISPRHLEPYGIKLNLYGPLEFCVFGCVTIGLAALSYRFIEQPIFRLRDRLTPR